jgi:hypothetical protein
MTASLTVDGFVSAGSDGILKYLQDVNNTMDNYIDTGTHSYTVLMMIDPEVAITDSGTPYDNPGLFTEGNGNFGIVYTSNGVTVYHFSGSYKTATRALGTGSWSCVAARYNAATDKLSVDVDGTRNETSSVGDLASVAAGVHVAADFNPTKRFTGAIMEIIAIDSALTDAQMTGIRNYLKSRYPSAALP